MSLINDALKRAQAEKPREGQSPAPVPQLQPVVDAPAASSNMLPWASLLIGVGAIGIATALWFKEGSNAPQQFARSETPVTTQSQPASPEQLTAVQAGSSAAANIPVTAPTTTAPSSQPQTVPDTSPAPMAANSSSAKTPETVIPTSPTPVLAANSPTVVAESSAPAAANPTPAEPVTETKVVSTATPTPAAAVQPAAAVPTVTAPAPAESPARLQAIYYRLRGPTVVINGKTLSVGQSVDDVKVVSIQRTSVEVVQDGNYRTLTLND